MYQLTNSTWFSPAACFLPTLPKPDCMKQKVGHVVHPQQVVP